MCTIWNVINPYPRPLLIHAFTMQPHGSSSEESSADRSQYLARLRAQRHRAQQRRDSSCRSQRLACQREREPRCHEHMLAYQITAAITACIIIIDMAIWLLPLPELTGANRFTAMRDSDERITSIFHTLPARPPAFYVYPSHMTNLLIGKSEINL